MRADVDHRWFVRGAKQVMAVIHRPSPRRRHHEQRLKVDAECNLHFFRLAPRLAARRLPRRLAFGKTPPHSHKPRLNRMQRGLERPPRKKEPPLPPRFGMVAGTSRRGGFFCRPKQSLFLEPPLPRGERWWTQKPCRLTPLYMGRCRGHTVQGFR